MIKIFYLSLLTLSILGCSPSAEESYKSGYQDGYAQGYNSGCKLDITPTNGDWNNIDYTKGYNAGQIDGSSKAYYAARADNCKKRSLFER